MQQNGKTPKRRPQIISWNVELPLNYPCQIYPRVSTPEQKKNVSAEMQKDKSFAISCGWIDNGHSIILDDRDLGVSGQLKMEDRPAFKALLRRIANGEIKAVIASNVDRLFRNKWGDEPGKFMEICYRYGVIVVTPDFVYDFQIN
jgi:DNA invertase Pin-like site-specific DNA recombinase